MRSHVTRDIAQCFAVLRHLRLISWMLSSSALQTVVVALVLSWLDYVNSVLTGLPAYLVKRLQSVVFNASACLIYGLRRFDVEVTSIFDHVSETLMMLHWLHIPERIQFKLVVLVHRVLHGNDPDYLGPSTITAFCIISGQNGWKPSSSLDCQCKGVSGGWKTVKNSLPVDIAFIDSPPIFRRCLKNYLFLHSYPGTIQ